MVDAINWLSLAIAWVTTWWAENHKVIGAGECNCNCTCEIISQPCPTSSWWWELAKASFILVTGILLGAGQLVLGLLRVFRVACEVVKRASSPTEPGTSPRTLPSTTPTSHVVDPDTREQALRQLVAVRARRSQRS